MRQFIALLLNVYGSVAFTLQQWKRRKTARSSFTWDSLGPICPLGPRCPESEVSGYRIYTLAMKYTRKGEVEQQRRTSPIFEEMR